MTPSTGTYGLDDLAELQAYLGDDFDLDRLQRYEEVLDREYEEVGDEQQLYRTSQAYLYNLTAFAMTGTKLPYLAMLERLAPPPARLLDYGCGIGADGLRFLERGYDVTFADFANPSTQYLRWRLERRGVEAAIYDLDAGPPPAASFDLAYAFDVIEHVPDPFAFLAAMEATSDRVLVNLLEPDPGETELHHELPIAEILNNAAGREPFAYERHHGRSHVVMYGQGRAPSWRAALRRARLPRLR